MPRSTSASDYKTRLQAVPQLLISHIFYNAIYICSHMPRFSSAHCSESAFQECISDTDNEIRAFASRFREQPRCVGRNILRTAEGKMADLIEFLCWNWADLFQLTEQIDYEFLCCSKSLLSQVKRSIVFFSRCTRKKRKQQDLGELN